jgi:hypothetical protein
MVEISFGVSFVIVPLFHKSFDDCHCDTKRWRSLVTISSFNGFLSTPATEAPTDATLDVFPNPQSDAASDINRI